MTTHKEALTLALEKIRFAVNNIQVQSYNNALSDLHELDCAIKEALAQPEQEPVAWELGAEVYWGDSPELSDYVRKEGTPLYTTPPQRKPLTDEELRVIENKINPNMRWRSSDEESITLYPQEYYELVRAIEAAHGIKE